MFDYAVSRPKDQGKGPRYMTAGVSMIAHLVVLGVAVGLPILNASDQLPEPPDMMAFVVAAPPPPPPPPPPPAPAPKKPEVAKPSSAPVAAPRPVQPDPVAAPTEAPKEITPETGREGPITGKPAAVEAGFEGGIPGGVPGGVVGGIESAPPPPPPSPAPKPQGPVRVGGQIKAPQLTNRVNPTYPAVAQTAQIEGVVVLEATVNKSGHVQNVRVVKGHPLLQSAAVDAVKQWQYEPLTLNGEAHPFILTVTVSFTMPR